MAADRSGPWSRWDGFSGGGTQVNQMIPPGYQYDVTGNIVAPVNQTTISDYMKGATLVDQQVNTIDPSYYDCIYGLPNSAATIIQQCYKDYGCCKNGCCKDKAWEEKYGWAVGLIVFFCVIVIFAVVITLGCWLVNRAKDKRQKRSLMAQGISPSTSQISLAQPIQGGYHFGTGPFQNPPANGYRY